MPLYPTWPDILLRLALTLVAGGVIGFNREIHGHAAGLRTTTLVALAAAIAMIQANLLLPVDGHTPGSFVTLDLMRLPLGILTGVGFIGGGAILKRGDSISGVTTAATLWIVTTIGLCFGGGQIGLGVVATVLGVATILGMKQIDMRVSRRCVGSLTLVGPQGAPFDLSVPLAAVKCRARFVGQNPSGEPDRSEFRYSLNWPQKQNENRAPAIVAALRNYNVSSFEMAADGAHG